MSSITHFKVRKNRTRSCSEAMLPAEPVKAVQPVRVEREARNEDRTYSINEVASTTVLVFLLTLTVFIPYMNGLMGMIDATSGPFSGMVTWVIFMVVPAYIGLSLLLKNLQNL